MRGIVVLLITIILPVTVFPEFGEFHEIRNFAPGEYGAHKQNWSIAQDDRGIMYFANSHGVLEFDSESWRLIPLPGKSGAYSLAKGPDGRVYAGGKGIFGYLEPNEKGQMQFKSLTDKIPKKHRDGTERAIQAGVTPEGVIFLFERRMVILNKDKATVFTAKKYFYCFLYSGKTLYVIDDVRGFMKLRDGRMVPVPGGRWLQGYVLLPFKDDKILIITMQRGPVIYDPGGKVDAYSPFINESSDYFSGNLISCGLLLNGHPDHYRLVLGSIEKGIMVFNMQGREVEYIDIHHGLQDRHVYDLYRDRGGNVWAALDSGISMLYMAPDDEANKQRFNTKGVTYPGAAGGTEDRPVPSAAPPSPGTARAAAGKPAAFAALIRGCKKHADGSPIFGGTFFDKQSKIQVMTQPDHQVPTFSYAYNGFRFSFSSNYFEKTERTEYQCYLENLDKGWSNWIKRNTREYTSLPWGTYTLRVRARNHRGEIGKEAAYTFKVTPPWYETWWFLSSQVTFILMILVMSRLMERIGMAAKFSGHMIIFVVVIIFEYVNGFLGPIIGRYSDNIAFFGILMTAALSFVIGPAQEFILNLMKKIIKGD